MRGELPKKCKGFDWNKGNLEKNWKKHKVSPFECEQVFFNQPLIIANDEKHSSVEKRYYTLGRTDLDRYLFIAFTVRKNLIRVISARDMNKKEKKELWRVKKRKSQHSNQKTQKEISGPKKIQQNILTGQRGK